MPAIVGSVNIVNIGSSGVFHIGDVFVIRPISFAKTIAGSGSFNVGETVAIYNYQNATNVSDTDYIDQPISFTY
ncbi:spore germination protein [Ectobacillus polymachus]|uniref:spore germination protein n=1 Tax=Ectobacillus polymachus TaxID=1508806 RepID=UPI003A8C5674